MYKASKKQKNSRWNCVFISPFNFIMDVEPKNWTRTCEASKQLRKDLAEGIIDPRNYKPALVKKKPRRLFGLSKVSVLNIVTSFAVVSQLGSEKMLVWVETGKSVGQSPKKVSHELHFFLLLHN